MATRQASTYKCVSALTIICLLEGKGHLTQRGEGKAHVYKAKTKEAADAHIRRLLHFSSEFWMKTH